MKTKVMRVRWDIDVEVEDTGDAKAMAFAAAREAREMQGDDSIALSFLVRPLEEVRDEDYSYWTAADLFEDDDEEG